MLKNRIMTYRIELISDLDSLGIASVIKDTDWARYKCMNTFAFAALLEGTSNFEASMGFASDFSIGVLDSSTSLLA